MVAINKIVTSSSPGGQWLPFKGCEEVPSLSDPLSHTFFLSYPEVVGSNLSVFPGSNPRRPELQIPVRYNRRRAGGTATGHPREQRDRHRVLRLQAGQGPVQGLHGPGPDREDRAPAPQRHPEEVRRLAGARGQLERVQF